MKKLLFTGRAGFIGSHSVVELLQRGHGVVVYDNLSNPSPAVLKRLSQTIKIPINFIEGDIRDAGRLE